MQKDGSFVSCVPLASPPHYLLLESTSSLQSPFTLWHTVHHTVDMLEVRSIQNVETKKLSLLNTFVHTVNVLKENKALFTYEDCKA